MMNKVRNLFKLPLRLLPIVVFGVLLTATVNIFIAYQNYITLSEELEETVEENEKEVWSELSDIIEESYYSSKLASNIISLNIENSILKEYSDLDTLQEQFDSGNYSKEFHDILKENIERDDIPNTLKVMPYFTIVGKIDSILVTFSNNDMGKLRQVDTESTLTWEEFIDMTPNPKMTSDAISYIFNKSPNIIFTQTSEFRDEYKYTNYISMNTLREVYEDKGIEGLKNFSLLTPSYITNSGDVFGNEDTYYLSKNDTHKIITIQVISLDTILAQHQEYIDLKIKNNSIEEEYFGKRLLNGLITTALITLFLFIISIFLIGIHNAESERKIKECGECSKKGE